MGSAAKLSSVLLTHPYFKSLNSGSNHRGAMYVSEPYTQKNNDSEQCETKKRRYGRGSGKRETLCEGGKRKSKLFFLFFLKRETSWYTWISAALQTQREGKLGKRYKDKIGEQVAGKKRRGWKKSLNRDIKGSGMLRWKGGIRNLDRKRNEGWDHSVTPPATTFTSPVFGAISQQPLQ